MAKETRGKFIHVLVRMPPRRGSVEMHVVDEPARALTQLDIYEISRANMKCSGIVTHVIYDLGYL